MCRYLDQVNITNAFSMSFYHIYRALLKHICRQWHEGRPRAIRPRAQLRKRYLECSIRLWSNSFKLAAYQSKNVTLFFEEPSILTRFKVNAPLYIAFIELSWTIFTFATAGVQNVNQLYVFRFLYVFFWSKSFVVSNLIIVLVYLRPATSQRSCTYAQATTNPTSWPDGTR